MKKRIITAVIALIIVVPLILLGGACYELLICLVGALAYKELIDLPKSHGKIPIQMVFIGLLLLLTMILSNNTNLSLYNGHTYQILALLVLCLVLPIIFYKEGEYSSKDALYLLGSVFFLGLAFNSFLVVGLRSLKTLLYLLVIPMFNDIFAYLIGSKLGRHKMCPSISPNKTWEGSIGGLLFGVVAGVVLHKVLLGSVSLGIVATCMILSVAGQVGDLVMSRIKRENGIKDFSNLLPGHGGILDRLDSSIFVFLTYMILVAF